MRWKILLFFFFKDSLVRCEEFFKLQELGEPGSTHIALVQHHRIRWLSLADCVERIMQLLPMLVRLFEEQALDTANCVAVQTKCQ